jgi:Right handed beta helix region
MKKLKKFTMTCSKTASRYSSMVLALVIVIGGIATASASVTCTATGFFRDGINMTAAQINPSGTVSGDVDATGCNVGVYYDQGTGVVNNANVHGANYFGVLVNGDDHVVAVDVTGSTVSSIGETPHNGTQHGVGIYYRAFGAGSTSGKVAGNVVGTYQKGGITVNGASTVTVSGNTVTGDGRVDWISQNGIQVGYGATAQVKSNVVSGNAYTGLNCASSGGVLVVGGAWFGTGVPLTTGTQITGNTLVNNDVGVFLYNADASGSAPTTPTSIKVTNNTITNDALTNLGGCGHLGYQAGVSDFGDNDKITNNAISGLGYTFPGNDATFAIPIDISGTNLPKVHANK